jgi:hypothetical protein
MNQPAQPPAFDPPKHRRIPVEFVPVQHEYPIRETIQIMPALRTALEQSKASRRLNDSGAPPHPDI